MKKFTNFTIFFVLLVAGICSLLFLVLDISAIVQYIQATNEIEKDANSLLMLTYTTYTIGSVLLGSIISVFIYQIKRIADNIEK